MSNLSTWVFDWYMFGDIWALCADDCINPPNKTKKKYACLMNFLLDKKYQNCDTLKKVKIGKPKDMSLLIWLIQYFSDKYKSHSRYQWNKKWNLNVSYHKGMSVAEDEIILFDNNCVLPYTPFKSVLDKYNEIVRIGCPEEEIKEIEFSDDKLMERALHVHTLLICFEQIFINNANGSCKEFKDPDVPVPDKSKHRKEMLVTYAESVGRRRFKLPDNVDINLLSGEYYSDEARIKVDKKTGNQYAYAFEFGGTVRDKNNKSRKCDEKPPPEPFTPKPLAHISLSEYPCGGLTPCS